MHIQEILHKKFIYKGILKIICKIIEQWRKKDALVVFSSQELYKTLIAIAKTRLTAKQKKILDYLIKSSIKCNATQLVSSLSYNLKCSKSAVWNNLNSLKRSRIIYYGSIENRGIAVELSIIGARISKCLRVKNE